MADIRIIGGESKNDINIPNRPFEITGRMIPSYTNERWSYTVKKYDKTETMRFPDENYDYDAMKQNNVFIGANDKDVYKGTSQHGKSDIYFYLDL